MSSQALGWLAGAAAPAQDADIHRFLLTILAAAACLSVPAAAFAQDTLVAPDPAAEQITALDGTIVWVSGRFGSQRIFQRTPDRTIAPVKGAPQSRSYRSIDLGRDSDGKLRLTYLRCDTSSSCKALWDDLDGRRATFRNLEAPGCKVNTAVSQWRTRLAYGLFCTGSATNQKPTGLYVKNGSRKPVRLPRPRYAVRFGVRTIESVDLRGERVAAVAAGIYEYSYSQTVGGRDMRWLVAAASEGDSDENARGLAVQSATTHWTLTNSSHAGDPNVAVIFRQAGGCLRRELLVSPPNATQEFEATDLAADGATLYLVNPSLGIVKHAFSADPRFAC